MATYTGGVGSSGKNLGGGVYDIGITLAAGEYPVKVRFDTKSGGAYWTNRVTSAKRSATISLCGGSGGNPSVTLGTITLDGGRSNVNTPEYSIDGSTLAGCSLYLSINNGSGGVNLRNYCAITVETSGGGSTEEETEQETVPPFSPDVYKKLLPTVGYDGTFLNLARRATWQIKVEGVDCTAEIEKNLISIEITDNEEDAADDLQIKISDRDATWLQKWLDDTIQAGAKTKGLKFQVWIGMRTDSGAVTQQKAGTFVLDTVKHSGPPAVCVIKCLSVDYAGGIRTEKRDYAWEGYTLYGIAADIAKKGGLKLLYCTENNPKLYRKEQDQQTDLEFLVDLCHDYGVSIKITDGQMVLFKRSQYEGDDAIATFKYGDGSYLKWDVSTGTGDVTYDSCTVKYYDPETAKLITGTYKTAEYDENDDDEHQELVITDIRVKSIAEAEQIAEMRLKLKNLFERKVKFTVPGNPQMIAGIPVVLSGFGYWNGKYMIRKAKHSITKSGYTTQIELRKI